MYLFCDIDGVLIPYPGLDHDWARARTAAGRPTLLIQPDSRTGLQAEHAQNVLRWAAALELQHSA